MYTSDGRASPELSRAEADKAVEIYRQIGDRAGEAKTLWAISNTYWTTGDSGPEGIETAERALAVFREIDDRFQIGWSSYTVALFALLRAELGRAAERLVEALGIFADAGDVSAYVLILDAVALLAHRSGDAATAARLSGAVAELERRTGTGLNPMNRVAMDWKPEELKDDPATAEDWLAGALMTSAEAVDLAREFLASVPSRVAGAEPASSLPGEAGS
jgi:hypothetical protein